jgi:hypothetical protein
VAIHTALTNFEIHYKVGIFTESMSSLYAIHLQYNNPGASISPNYHHHMLLIKRITGLLEARPEHGCTTTMRKIRARTTIRGKNLVDVAAKLEVKDFDSYPRTKISLWRLAQ